MLCKCFANASPESICKCFAKRLSGTKRLQMLCRSTGTPCWGDRKCFTKHSPEMVHKAFTKQSSGANALQSIHKAFTKHLQKQSIFHGLLQPAVHASYSKTPEPDFE